MYSKVNLADVPERDPDAAEPTVQSVGYELRPENVRPNVWRYEAGESSPDHHHEEQEELYVVLEGEFVLTVEGEELALEPDDYVVVSPESRRRLTAKTDATVLIVGAPNVKDDSVVHA